MNLASLASSVLFLCLSSLLAAQDSRPSKTEPEAKPTGAKKTPAEGEAKDLEAKAEAEKAGKYPTKGADAKLPSPKALVAQCVPALIGMQEDGGEWPYEGVYRVARELPIGYRIGGTSIVAATLLRVAPDDEAARAAVARGLAFVLAQLSHPLMEPSTKDAYDVRIWGHCCALEFLCVVRAAGSAGKQGEEIDRWIKTLIATLVTEEIDGGGWNYANHRAHAAFVTGPVAQALLFARAQGEAVPDAVLERARQALQRSRYEDGAFAYSGPASTKGQAPMHQIPGAIGRSPVSEATLLLLGAGDLGRLRAAIDAFHEHWHELEARRQKTGTHEGPYKIAPYYFYYAHRYLAQAIELLPENEREAQRARLLEKILRTRSDSGTWNDRVFPRSQNFGTSMVVLSLLGATTPIPPALQPATKQAK